MRYWLTRGDGRVLGPFELEELHTQVRNGALAPEAAMLCLEGGSEWVAATKLLLPSVGQDEPRSPVPVAAAPASHLVGIGGWLILPAIGLVLGPILGIIGLLVGLALFKEVSRAGYGGLYALELLVSGGFLALLIYTAVQFFSKRKIAPKLIVIIYCLRVVVSIVLLGIEIGVGAQDFAIQTGRQLVFQIVGGAVWIPYFLVSKRVKATFVN